MGRGAPFSRIQQATGLAILILVLASASSIAAHTGWSITRTEEPDQNWLIGVLTWNEGVGRIVWAEEAPSEPFGGHKAPPPDGDPPAPHVFESQPIPRELFLNASRNVQLDLWIKPSAAGGCGDGSSAGRRTLNDLAMRIVLMAGERIVAGSDGYSSVEGQYVNDVTYDQCLFRMAAEESVLKAGRCCG